MTDNRPEIPRETTPDQVRLNFMQRRREKIVEEIQRNRRGEYVVPTWVLALALFLMVAGIAALLIFA